MQNKTILFNGIPSSGKSTLAYLLHLKLEHKGYKTIYLDDEVIKRQTAAIVGKLVDFLNAPITIIVSCDPTIEAEIKFWCDLPIIEAEKRNLAKLSKENAPIYSDYTNWSQYWSEGIKIDTTKSVDECMEQIKCELKKKNLNF